MSSAVLAPAGRAWKPWSKTVALAAHILAMGASRLAMPFSVRIQSNMYAETSAQGTTVRVWAQNW
jgi:hypothetical protein